MIHVQSFVHMVGDTVRIISIGLPGTVTALMYENAGYQYRVVWWSDNQRRCEWLFDFEICERS